jgi:hypothetical protein
MKLTGSLNRTVNLVATVITSLAGFAFMPEIFIEDKSIYKLDDGILLITGIASIIWYKSGKNSLSRSTAPLFFTFFSLVIKIAGIIFEIKEKDDVGDDFGGLILFILGFSLVFYLYQKVNKINEINITS